MSRALAVLRQMMNGTYSSAGDDDAPGGFDSGYEAALEDLTSAGDLDSGAWLDKVRQNRGERLAQRSAKVLGKVGGSSPVVAKAAALEVVQVDAAARRQINKDKFRLYRYIPLLAAATIAAAGTGTINTTPTNKGFGEYIIAMGLFRIDTLNIGGQTLVPNGAISTAGFQGNSNGNLPVNLYINTTPITGGVTNNSAAAVYAGLDMLIWMEDSASSERY